MAERLGHWHGDVWSVDLWGVHFGDPTGEGAVGAGCAEGHWHGDHWAQAHFNPDYWGGTCISTVTFLGLLTRGGDDKSSRGRGRGYRRLIIEEVDEEFDEYLKYRQKLVKRNLKILEEEDMEAAALLLLAMEM